MRYRLDVVAAGVGDVVRYAGGWLFDRSVAGWEVTVLVAELADPRPLRILGVDVVDLETVLALEAPDRRPQSLAVDADLCARDPRARDGVRRALEYRGIEVVVWGEGWPSESGHGVDPVVHRLSVAARAFKHHALVAAGFVATEVGTLEIFRSGAPVGAPLGVDLVPAG